MKRRYGKTASIKTPRELFTFLVLMFLALFFSATAGSAVTLLNQPSTCSGQWSYCTRAFADDTNRATATATNNANKSSIWSSYGFSIPASAAINGVVVRADFFASNFRGYINIRVSGDGGATYGPSHIVGGNTAEKTFLIDVTNDTSWTAAKLNNANFHVNVTCFKVDKGTNPTCRLDYLPVLVTYTSFDFGVSVNPMAATVAQGSAAQSTVTVNLAGGVPQNVALTESGCPSATTCSFNPTSGNPTYTSTFTVITTSSTPPGTYEIDISGTGDGKSRTATYTLTITGQPVNETPIPELTPTPTPTPANVSTPTPTSTPLNITFSNATPTPTPTSNATCSWISDGICPSTCAAGSDADCCTQSGYCWVSGTCYTSCPTPTPGTEGTPDISVYGPAGRGTYGGGADVVQKKATCSITTPSPIENFEKFDF